RRTRADAAAPLGSYQVLVLYLTSALFQVLGNMTMKRPGYAVDEYINVWGRFAVLLPVCLCRLCTERLARAQARFLRLVRGVRRVPDSLDARLVGGAQAVPDLADHRFVEGETPHPAQAGARIGRPPHGVCSRAGGA